MAINSFMENSPANTILQDEENKKIPLPNIPPQSQTPLPQDEPVDFSFLSEDEPVDFSFLDEEDKPYTVDEAKLQELKTKRDAEKAELEARLQEFQGRKNTKIASVIKFRLDSLPTDEELAVEASDIAEGGAPFGARARASFGVDDDINAAKVALAKSFEKDVEVFQDDVAGILFKDPETGEIKQFDPNSLDVGDIADVAGELPVLAAETLVGIIAARNAAKDIKVEKGIVGKLTTGLSSQMAAGTALGETVKLAIGDYLGVSDLSFTEKSWEVLKSALISYAATGSLSKLADFLGPYNNTKMADAEAARKVANAIGEKATEAIKRGKEMEGQLTDIGVKPTTTDLARLGQQDPDFVATEGVKKLERITNKVQDAENSGEYFDVLSGNNQAILDVANQRLGKNYQSVNDVTDDDIDLLLEQYDNLNVEALMNNDDAYGLALAQAARQKIEKGFDIIEQKFRDEYTEFFSRSLNRVQLTKLRDAAKLLVADEKTLNNLYTPEDIKVIKRFAFGAPKGKTKTVKDPLTLKEKTIYEDVPDEAEFKELANTIKVINQRLFEGKKGSVGGVSRATLTKFKQALDEQVEMTLKDTPEDLQKYRLLSDRYSQYQEDFKRTFLGKFVATDDNGNYIIDADNMIKQMSKSTESSKQVIDAMSANVFNRLGLGQDVRDAAMDYMLGRVVKNGKIDVKSWEKLVNENDGKTFSNLKKLLGPDFANISQPEKAVKYISNVRNRNASYNEAVNDAAKMKIQIERPVETTDKLLSANPDDAVNALRTIKRQSSRQKQGNQLAITDQSNRGIVSVDPIENIKDVVSGKMRNILVNEKNGNITLDGQKFGDFLTKNDKVLRELYDDNYVDFLKELSSNAIAIKPTTSSQLGVDNEINQLVNDAARIVAPPLGTRGRVWTFIKNAINRTSGQNVVNVMLDPDKFLDFEEKLIKAKTFKAALAVAGRYGISFDAEDERKMKEDFENGK